MSLYHIYLLLLAIFLALIWIILKYVFSKKTSANIDELPLTIIADVLSAIIIKLLIEL